MFYISIFLVVIFISILFSKSFLFVRENEVAVIEKNGHYNRTLGEGIYFIIPFWENTRWIEADKDSKWYSFFLCKKIKTNQQIMTFPKDNRVFFSIDNKQYKVKCNVVYKIIDAKKAVYEVVYLFDALNQLVAGILQKRLIDANENESQIERIKYILDNALDISNDYAKKWGVEIIKIKLKQIIDPNGIRHNIEA